MGRILVFLLLINIVCYKDINLRDRFIYSNKLKIFKGYGRGRGSQREIIVDLKCERKLSLERNV